MKRIISILIVALSLVMGWAQTASAVGSGEAFPALRISHEPARLHAHLLDYQNQKGRAAYVMLPQLESGKVGASALTFDEQGNATIEVDILYPRLLGIWLDSSRSEEYILAVPGEDTYLTIDLSKLKGEPCIVDSKGPMAQMAAEYSALKYPMLRQVDLSAIKNDGAKDGTRQASADQYAESIMSAYAKALADMEARQVLPETRAQLECLLQFSILSQLRSSGLLSDSRLPMSETDILAELLTRLRPDCIYTDHALMENLSFLWCKPEKDLPLLERIYPKGETAHDVAHDLYVLHAACSSKTITPEHVSRVRTPELREVLEGEKHKRDSMEASLRADKHIFHETYDHVAPEAILDTIVARYKGKAVLVDLWATWCGPCRAGHKAMEPMKKEMAAENVVFVYLTGPSSDLLEWQKMIAEIPGDHYYLTQEQWTQVCKTYQTTSIPTYAIYDTTGRMTFSRKGLPYDKEKEQIDIPLFRTELEKAM